MKKVILVTSCVNNEGKSFVALNLAAACAMPGKNVALLEFDTSKPGLENDYQLTNSMGLTDYLTGQTKDLFGLSHSIKGVPTLHVYPSGSVSSYPADLLLTDKLRGCLTC